MQKSSIGVTMIENGSLVRGFALKLFDSLLMLKEGEMKGFDWGSWKYE